MSHETGPGWLDLVPHQHPVHATTQPPRRGRHPFIDGLWRGLGIITGGGIGIGIGVAIASWAGVW